MPQQITAIDARLVTTRNSGDTSYWRGLIGGLMELAEPDTRFLLFSNVDRPEMIPESGQFEWIKIRAKRSVWWSLVQFPLRARNMGASAIHTQYSLSPLVGHRGVTTIHDVSPLINPDWFSAVDSARFARQMPISAKIAQRIITVSETSKSEILERLTPAAGKVRVTYNGPSQWLKPLERDAARRQLVDRLGLSGPYVFTLGTRWKRKNTGLAVAAAELLSESLPHRLVVTGKAYGDETEEPGRRSVWTGYLEDDLIAALYSAADAYLLPSLHEGFGIPLLEAFASGCPVLCSRGGALPEIAADAAEVVPDFSPQTWADRLTSVLTDPSKVIGMRQRGFRRLQDFSWSRTAAETLAIYREVAACR